MTSHQLEDAVDPSRIGVIGTQRWRVRRRVSRLLPRRPDLGRRRLRTPRIDFEGGEFRFSGLPLLVVHGPADQIIALDQSEMVRDEAKDALLVIQADADHFQPVYTYERPEVLALSEQLLTTFLDVHLAGVAALDELQGLLAMYVERISVR